LARSSLSFIACTISFLIVRAILDINQYII